MTSHLAQQLMSDCILGEERSMPLKDEGIFFKSIDNMENLMSVGGNTFSLSLVLESCIPALTL